MYRDIDISLQLYPRQIQPPPKPFQPCLQVIHTGNRCLPQASGVPSRVHTLLLQRRDNLKAYKWVIISLTTANIIMTFLSFLLCFSQSPLPTHTSMHTHTHIHTHIRTCTHTHTLTRACIQRGHRALPSSTAGVATGKRFPTLMSGQRSYWR